MRQTQKGLLEVLARYDSLICMARFCRFASSSFTMLLSKVTSTSPRIHLWFLLFTTVMPGRELIKRLSVKMVVSPMRISLSSSATDVCKFTYHYIRTRRNMPRSQYILRYISVRISFVLLLFQMSATGVNVLSVFSSITAQFSQA